MSERDDDGMGVTLLAAFKSLLYRHARQQDILVAVPIDNRDRLGMQGVIGPLTNLTPVRTQLSGWIPFREMPDRVRESVRDARAHSLVLFDGIARKVEPNPQPGHNPLAQVMFDYRTAREAKWPADSNLDSFQVLAGASRFDLTLSLEREIDGLNGSFQYNGDLFDGTTIKRLAGHFLTMLEALSECADSPLLLLPILTEAERHQLLVEWNDSGRDYPSSACIPDLIEAQVERTPDRTAAISEEGQLTYGALNARANRLAHYLMGLGVGPEVFVGVCLERSLEMVVAMLAVLKSGGAYIPLDPEYPGDRLDFMLKDGRAAVLLTEETLVGLVPAEHGTVVCLDSNLEIADRLNSLNPATAVQPGNVAYSIYTSGSTGRPKGIAIQHRTAVTLLHWSRECFTRDELDGVLASTSICFDMSVFELFGTLSWGGTIILAKNALHLPSLPAANQVVLLDTVPSAIRELLRIGGIPRSVRTVNMGGEALSEDLVHRVLNLEHVTAAVNLYGPSEDTTFTTAAFMTKDNFHRVTLGHPVASTELYVVDPTLRPVPIGVVGEIYIGGGGLTRGYLNRPDLTAASFLPNPFRSNGERMYKTGDLARYLPEGRLEFLGRADHQVKIRGYRVELGEIESALASAHPGVRECLVVAREDAPGEKRLVAYVVTERGEPLAVNDLKRALGGSLPDYMIPSNFIFLEAMPLTPNGKVNRMALPPPGLSRPLLDNQYAAPQTEIERGLASLVEDVLGVGMAGIHDSLFDLGGHSLLITELISRVRNLYGVELKLRQVFETPTIAGIAKLVEGASTGEGRAAKFGPRPVPRDRDLPLSFSQERVWFVQRLEPESLAYNFQSLVRFKGPLNPRALDSTLSAIVERHEIWRTTFVEKDGRLVQKIQEAFPVSVPVRDLHTFPAGNREAEAQREVDNELKQPFDLSRLPLVRWVLFRLDPEDHIPSRRAPYGSRRMVVQRIPARVVRVVLGHCGRQGISAACTADPVR